MKMTRPQMFEYIKVLRKKIKQQEDTIKRHEEALSWLVGAQRSMLRILEHQIVVTRQDKNIKVTDTPISPVGSDDSSDDVE